MRMQLIENRQDVAVAVAAVTVRRSHARSNVLSHAKRVLEYGVRAPVSYGNLRFSTQIPTGNLF